MNPIIPHADPLPLAGPAWLLWVLLMLTFTLHVVAMNLLLGGAIVGAVSRWRARSGHVHEMELARVVGKALPILTASTVTLGVAALLFLQVLFGRLFFSSSVLMAWSWFAVIPLLIVAYYSAYAVAFKGHSAAATGLAALTALLLLVIAFMYANNMNLMLRPDLFRGIYARGGEGLHLGPFNGLLAARYLHMVTGAVAVAGAGVCVIGWIWLKRNAPGRSVRLKPDTTTAPAASLRFEPDTTTVPAEEFGRWAIGRGAAWFAGATILNVGWGVWYLGSVPVPTILALIGGRPLAAAALGIGIVLSLVALVALVSAPKTSNPTPLLGIGLSALALTLVLMIVTRDVVRRMAVDAFGFVPQNWVQPQWGPIAIFGALLVAAIAIVGWMVAAFVRAGRRAPAASGRADL